MADMDKIMDELLKTTAEEDELSNEDADIYNGSSHDDISGYDFGNSDEDEEEEYEDEWEYQTEYDEWENEMEPVRDDAISHLRSVRDWIDEILDTIDNSDHRYCDDDRENIEELIDDIYSKADDLYSQVDDYRSDPRDW